VVGAPPYSPMLSAFEFQIRRMRDAMRRHGDGATPLWIDEIGWGSGSGGSPLNKGPGGQAAMLRRAFTFVVRHHHSLGIDRVLWYPFRDSGHTPAGCVFCSTTGLLEPNGAPKPAWHSFRA